MAARPPWSSSKIPTAWPSRHPSRRPQCTFSNSCESSYKHQHVGYRYNMEIPGVVATISSTGVLSLVAALIAVLVTALTRIVSARSAEHQVEARVLPDIPEGIPPELLQQILDAPVEELSPGERETKAILDAYSKELNSEAQRIAKRVNAERPSKKHVRLAAERIGILRDRSGAISSICLSLGSILAGGGISFYVNIVTGGVPATGAAPWAIGSLVAGTGFAVGGIVVKLRHA